MSVLLQEQSGWDAYFYRRSRSQAVRHILILWFRKMTNALCAGRGGEKDAMGDKLLERKGDVCMLYLSERLTSSDAHDLRSLLGEAMGDVNAVVMDFEEVTETDLSCLQLFCSAKRTAAQTGKLLTFSGGNSLIIRKKAEAAGFVCDHGCGRECDDACVWRRVEANAPEQSE